MITLVLLLFTTNVELARLVSEISASGHVIAATASSSERVAPPPAIAPGGPPLLAFRYYEGQRTRSFTNTGLVLDDAGH